MGKWFNWMMWGITFPLLGALLSAILMFFAVKNGYLWQPQLAFLGIEGDAVAIVGAIGASLSFVVTIGISMIFWLMIGIISIITTPMLAKSQFKGSVNLIFVPWAILSFFFLLLNCLAAMVSPDPFSDVIAQCVNFIISTVLTYVIVWISVWMNGLFKAQRYLPY